SPRPGRASPVLRRPRPARPRTACPVCTAPVPSCTSEAVASRGGCALLLCNPLPKSCDLPTSGMLNAFCALQIPSPRSCQPDGASEEALQYEIEELKRKDLALDQEIAQFLSEGYSLEELEKHISLLHEYNDIKDAGQMLLGKLAVIRGVTTKQLYPEYDLELSD
uniref:DNA repair protein SWI5 homolog n=1 Tax=Dromaius novaehollandiae TaxID=8790 RepID=A0A8C4J6S8_DRONO